MVTVVAPLSGKVKRDDGDAADSDAECSRNRSRPSDSEGDRKRELETYSRLRKPGFRFPRKRMRIPSRMSSGRFATGSMRDCSKLLLSARGSRAAETDGDGGKSARGRGGRDVLFQAL